MNASVDPVAYPNLADTITVSLASTGPGHPILFTSKTTLATNGMAHCAFPAQALLGNYYVVVKHRNHMETWSGTAFGFNTADTTCDFTDFITKAYGNNMQQLATGVFGIYAGDVNQDGVIEATDYSILENDVQQVLFGYYRSDLNGDNVVEAFDYSMEENNVQLVIFVASP